MAKRNVTKKTGRTSRSQEFEDLPSVEDTGSQRNFSGRGRASAATAGEAHNYMGVVRELISNPAVKYVAGGIATALLSRLATNLSDRYPEISNFIRENLDQVEGKLSDYRSNNSESVSH